MKHIGIQVAHIGTLTITRESVYLPFGARLEPYYILRAYDLGQVVAQESYEGHTDQLRALRALLLRLDICTAGYVLSNLRNVTAERRADLLSGTVPGFSSREYFARIPGSEYYQHYTRRPVDLAKEA